MHDLLDCPAVRILPEAEPAIVVRPTRDIAFIQRTVDRPEINEAIRDDSNPEKLTAADWVGTEGNIFLRVDVGTQVAGFLAFLPKELGYAELHTCLLPEFHGGVARQIAAVAFAWVFENTPIHTITTMVFSHARHINLMARWVGFKETHRAPWPNPVKGYPAVAVYYELTKPPL
jgi:RimJ/RimL family protein N-acetyltransferase